LLGGLLISIYPTIRHWSSTEASRWLTDSVVAQFVAITVIEGLTLLLLIAFLRWRKTTLASIGLIKPKLKDFLYSLAGFAIYFPGLIAIMSLLKLFIPHLNLDQKQQIGFDHVGS